ncbi:MAG TPA: hypothetical protein VIF14_17350 [Alphaproteobacteria bacterium]|jgi:hypothetical protein
MKCTPFLCAGRSVGAFAVAAALGMVFAPSTPSLAEIEPKYYREWQDKAPEVLTIRVGAVKPVMTSERHRSGDGMLIHTRIEAEATVEEVERSASGLKPGDTIRIHYTTTRAEPSMVGPRPLPVLKRGETYPAFLLGVSNGLYAPAARGASFEPLIKLN